MVQWLKKARLGVACAERDPFGLHEPQGYGRIPPWYAYQRQYNNNMHDAVHDIRVNHHLCRCKQTGWENFSPQYAFPQYQRQPASSPKVPYMLSDSPRSPEGLLTGCNDNSHGRDALSILSTGVLYHRR